MTIGVHHSPPRQRVGGIGEHRAGGPGGIGATGPAAMSPKLTTSPGFSLSTAAAICCCSGRLWHGLRHVTGGLGQEPSW